MDPVADQANRYMSFIDIVKPTEWLVHFSNDAYSIAKNGFQYGSDLDGLHLTTNKGDKQRFDEWGSFAFAFWADSRYAISAANNRKYGNEAVMFKSNSAIAVIHSGDEETQVIFEKEHAVDLVYLHDEYGDWAIDDVVTRRLLIQRENFKDIVDWVKNNFVQYRKRIVSR